MCTSKGKAYTHMRDDDEEEQQQQHGSGKTAERMGKCLMNGKFMKFLFSHSAERSLYHLINESFLWESLRRSEPPFLGGRTARRSELQAQCS